MSAAQFIKSYIAQSAEVVVSLRDAEESIAALAEVLCQVARNGGRIYACGNGGSACDAMHLTEELVARYLRERPGIRAQHLLDPGTMSCWANDYDFASVFKRQVEALMTPADVLVVFTTSGNSQNVLQAVAAANKIGATTIALSGRDGGKVRSLAKHCLIVKSDRTSHIQEAHAVIIHVLCDLLEQSLFGQA